MPGNIQIDDHLIWDAHVLGVRQKGPCNLNILKIIKPIINRENLMTVYRSIVTLIIVVSLWDSISETLANKLQKLQHRAAHIITSALYTKRSQHILHELGWSTLAEMRQQQKAVMMFKIIINGLTPSYLSKMFTFSTDLHDYNLD